jgi:hypothetical protein
MVRAEACIPGDGLAAFSGLAAAASAADQFVLAPAPGGKAGLPSSFSAAAGSCADHSNRYARESTCCDIAPLLRQLAVGSGQRKSRRWRWLCRPTRCFRRVRFPKASALSRTFVFSSSLSKRRLIQLMHRTIDSCLDGIFLLCSRSRRRTRVFVSCWRTFGGGFQKMASRCSGAGRALIRRPSPTNPCRRWRTATGSCRPARETPRAIPWAARGRTHRCLTDRQHVAGGCAAPGDHLQDPVAQASYTLNLTEKTATKGGLPFRRSTFSGATLRVSQPSGAHGWEGHASLVRLLGRFKHCRSLATAHAAICDDR